jgi:1,4-alpha-glucan branching enzyme
MIHKERLPDGYVRVTFELPSAIWAERVALVGDFNNWDPDKDQMFPSRSDGNWRITLELKAGRSYQFRYLVNGRDWHNDWHADEYAPNEFGTDNSVVVT